MTATDLGDKELKELRNARWEKAFSGADSSVSGSNSDADKVSMRSGDSVRSTGSPTESSVLNNKKVEDRLRIDRKATIIVSLAWILDHITPRKSFNKVLESI